MIEKDFLQDALELLVPDHPNWYIWAKIDSDGNTIPDHQRMQIKYVLVEETHTTKVKRPTDEAIRDKLSQLKNEEPMRVLREKRNLKLAKTDWRSSSDLPLSSEWTTYRQALRDLPSTATPTLDDEGNLQNVTWPEEPT
tara:strand:+ start:645 stop:1061 length:417 start_codon:yes stop_codon:yes gene_type:complete